LGSYGTVGEPIGNGWLYPEVQEFRSSGVQEFRSSGVQEFRSSGVQEFRSSGTVAARTKIQALNRNCAKCSKPEAIFPAITPINWSMGEWFLSRRDRVIVARHEVPGKRCRESPSRRDG
jgi:hypothetical protein